MNDLYDMLESFWKWVRNEPQNADAWYGIGTACVKLGHYDYAKQAFREVLNIEPENVAAWMDLGTTCNVLGYGEEALEAYREALKIRPDVTDAWKGIALIHIRSSDRVSASGTLSETRRDPMITDILSDLFDREG